MLGWKNSSRGYSAPGLSPSQGHRLKKREPLLLLVLLDLPVVHQLLFPLLKVVDGQLIEVGIEAMLVDDVAIVIELQGKIGKGLSISMDPCRAGTSPRTISS